MSIFIFFFKQKTAYEMRISDWSSDVCSSDLPLSALDAKVRVHLRHQIKELQRKLGVTTIMVTHDQEEALSMADRIVVMNHGVIEQIGTPTDIYRAPTSLFVADFIDRKSVVWGKSVSVRVDLGGRRDIKK